MASNSDPFPPQSLISELLASTQALLGFEKGDGVQFNVKPFSEKGAVILLPRNRRKLEEKLLQLLPLPDNKSTLDCKVFNFSEKFRGELVTILNQKLPLMSVRHYDLVYSNKICALIAHLQVNGLVTSCVEQLAHFEVNNQIGTKDKQIAVINLSCIEEAITKRELLSSLKKSPITTTPETRAIEPTCMLPTLDGFHSKSMGVALRNLIRLTASSVTLIDSFEWKLKLEEIRDQTEIIYQKCENSGLLVGEGNVSKIVVEKLNEELECTLKNHPKQDLREVLIMTGDGFSKEILLASLIVSILRINNLHESERVILFFRQKLRELVFRSLHLLYGLDYLKSCIDVLTHSNCDSTNSDFTADMNLRRDYLHKVLVERLEGDCLVDNKDLASKAKELCENTTKFELLSLSGSQVIKLVTSDKVGSHYSMFLLYNYARIAQILNKFQHLTATGVYGHLPEVKNTDFNLLELPTEWSLLVKYVLIFPDFLREHSAAPQLNSISSICRFLISLSQDFSSYYSKTKILLQSAAHLYPRVYARVHLVASLRRVMDICFRILEIKPPHQL